MLRRPSRSCKHLCSSWIFIILYRLVYLLWETLDAFPSMKFYCLASSSPVNNRGEHKPKVSSPLIPSCILHHGTAFIDGAAIDLGHNQSPGWAENEVDYHKTCGGRLLKSNTLCSCLSSSVESINPHILKDLRRLNVSGLLTSASYANFAALWLLSNLVNQSQQWLSHSSWQ